MRIARRTFLASSIGTAVAPAVMRLARAETPPITLKLHHAFSSVSSVHEKFIAPWARKVGTESGGRIRIDLFPSMQLGGAPAALFDQARDGSADIVFAAPSRTPARFPKIETFELPFVPSRRALVSSKALADFAAANLQDEFQDFYTICFCCSDRAVLHANRPVRTIEDVKDLKLHVQTRLAAEAMRTFGARPVIMPSAQIPVGISEHVIDACLDPWHLVPPLRLNDLLRSHTEFSDFSLSARTYVLAMNKASYDRLPRDLKSVIDSNSGQPAAALAGAMWDIQAAAVANMVVERGDLIVTLLPEAVAHWRKAAEPVIEAWRKEMKEQKIDGAKLLATARTLLTKYANEPEPASQTSSQTAPPRQQAVAQPVQPAPTSPPKVANSPPSVAPQPAGPGPTAKPTAPASQPPTQPPAHVATPAPPTAASSPPASTPPAPTPSVAPPAASNASAAPAAKTMAAPATTPTAAAGPPAAPATTIAPAVAPPPPGAPAAPPSVAAAPPPAATAPAVPKLVPKPVPKTLDIRM
jgi:TRAP-type C4-dicarboxylate transport system substrate-binding protein